MYSIIVGKRNVEEPAYLFELLNVDVELRTKFRFGVREGIDLIVQGPIASCFSIGSSTLDFVLGRYVSNLGVAVAENGLEVHFA